MNTILFPTDFSEAPEHAIHFAAMLCKTTQSGLMLMHVYNIFITTDIYGSTPAQMEPAIQENESKVQKLILELKESILDKYEYFKENPSLLRSKSFEMASEL